MGITKTILLSIVFLLTANTVSAKDCPKEPMPVTPELHGVLARAKKEMGKGRYQEALNTLTGFSRKNPGTVHPQVPFLKGLIQYRLKRFKNAETLFRGALEQNPCFGEAWQNLAVVYHGQKKPAQAANAMEKAFSFIKPENPDLKYQSALFRLMANEPQKALKTLRELTKRKNPPTDWLIALSRAQKASGQTRKAAATLEKAYRKRQDPELLYEAALLRLTSKEPKKAIPLLQKLARQPRAKRAWFMLLAQTLQKEKRDIDAAKVLQTAGKRFKAPELTYQAAIIFIHAGKPETALPLLEGLAKQKKVRSEWVLALSQVYVSLKKPAKAALAMEKANRVKPHPDHQYRAARLWIQADKPEKALPLLKTLCEKPDAPSECRTTLAHVLEKLGKNEEAAKLLADGKAGKKSTAESYRSALLYLKEGHPQKALPILKELSNTDNPDPQWLMALAMTLDQLEKPHAACEAMSKADACSAPLSSKLKLQMAIFWLNHDQAKRALPLLNSLAKEPRASKACGMAYIEALVRTGNPKGASVFLKQLLDRYPEDKRIWQLQAWVAIELEDYAKAAAALEVAFRLDPPKQRDWKRLGNLYRLAGVPKKAALAYEKAFANPATANDLDLLASTYAESHQMEKALAAAALAAKRGPTAKRFSRLGQLYMSKEEFQKGKEAFQKAAELDDNGGTNSLRAGYAAMKLDQLASARTAFESALEKADAKSQTAISASKAIESIDQMLQRQPTNPGR